MNHREVYRKHFGPIPKGFDIHHIDLDHSNNDPENLVAIPKDLHRSYHTLLDGLFGKGTTKDEINVRMFIVNDSYGSSYERELIYRLCLETKKIEEHYEKRVINGRD